MPRPVVVVQVKLKLNDTSTMMTCWVDDVPELKVGCLLELEGVVGKWEVVEKYSTEFYYSINRQWNVGGL